MFRHCKCLTKFFCYGSTTVIESEKIFGSFIFLLIIIFINKNGLMVVFKLYNESKMFFCVGTPRHIFFVFVFFVLGTQSTVCRFKALNKHNNNKGYESYRIN